MSSLVNTLGAAGLVVSGGLLTYAFLQWRSRRARSNDALQAQTLVEQARRDCEVLRRDARLKASEEALKQHAQTEQAIAVRRAERIELERRLAEREGLINSQLERMIEAEKNLAQDKAALRQRKDVLDNWERELAVLDQQKRDELQRLAKLNESEAREALLRGIEQQALKDANTLTRHILEEAKAQAEEKARKIISVALQRYAGEHTFENTTASIVLPSGDDIKGRIIGREGRNIRAFEAATGVTVLIDDTPGAVLLSGFDPVRREIAREAMG